MNKPMPSSVLIGYAPITIREMPGDEAVARDINGWWNYEQSLIEVAENIAPQVKAEVLLHEILHACCTFGNVGLNDEDEERVVQGMAPVLLDMLCNNPEVVKWLQEQIHKRRAEVVEDWWRDHDLNA
jgi:hypothetical protein